MENIHLSVDEQGIATITWDMQDQSMNVFSESSTETYIDLVNRVSEDVKIRGVLICSGKKEFIAGADIKMIQAMAVKVATLPKAEAAQHVFDEVYKVQKAFRKLETCGKPVAAAIGGLALGGGFEAALATHYRVVADDRKIKLGLPEAKLGIMPGWGGTQRVVRLTGVMAAAPIILEGRLISPQQALKNGLVHELAEPGTEKDSARAWIEKHLEEGDRVRAARAGGDKKITAEFEPPWDQKGFKLPGGDVYSPSGFPIFMGATAAVRKSTYGLYESQKAILSAVYEGVQVPMDAALRIEVRYFTKLMCGDQARNMSRTFFISKQALEKGARRPEQIEPQPVNKLGVLGGGGFMGAGIANVSARAGIEVVVIDQTDEAAAKARTYIEKDLKKQIERGRLTSEGAEKTLALITTTSDYSALKDCDLLVEAVFEDPAIKKSVTEQAEAHIGSSTIFATNTSTIPISDLANNSTRPEHYIGIHFFSPVEKMPLVEIISGQKTGDAAIAKAFDFVRQINKTPILVNDARFFYANRCVLRYIEESHYMLAEGVKPALIENAAKMIGMPVGPLSLADETALDLGLKIRNTTKAALGENYIPNPVEDQLDKMVLELGRLGRKSSSGFYDYLDDGKKYLWPGLSDMFGVAEQQPDVEHLKKRFLTIQALEALRALEENVITDVREADIGAIMGWGFAPWSGGPISYIDTVGAKQFLDDCEDLQAHCGARYEAPNNLREAAQSGASFYN